jgi:xanthine dehydrogenase accessory factor
MATLYQALAELEAKNEPGVICSIVRAQGSTPRHVGSKMLVYPDGRILGTVGGGEMESRVIAEAQKSLADGRPRLLRYSMSEPQRGDPGVCGGQVEIFVEPLNPQPTLVVIGAGHVGRAVAHLASWLGFHVVVNDDRPEFCNLEAVPAADEFVLSSMEKLPDQVNITPWTYLVLTTRGVPIDVKGLPVLLDTPAAYIGVIGSRRRWETTQQQLVETGIPQDRLDQVHSPMGLEIQAETPEEIAISILAEIIQLRRSTEPALQIIEAGAGS